MTSPTATRDEVDSRAKPRHIWLTLSLILGLELFVYVVTVFLSIFAPALYYAEKACGFTKRPVDTCGYAFLEATSPLSLISGMVVIVATIIWIVFRVRARKRLIWGPLVACLIMILVCVGSYLVNSHLAMQF